MLQSSSQALIMIRNMQSAKIEEVLKRTGDKNGPIEIVEHRERCVRKFSRQSVISSPCSCEGKYWSLPFNSFPRTVLGQRERVAPAAKYPSSEKIARVQNYTMASGHPKAFELLVRQPHAIPFDSDGFQKKNILWMSPNMPNRIERRDRSCHSPFVVRSDMPLGLTTELGRHRLLAGSACLPTSGYQWGPSIVIDHFLISKKNQARVLAYYAEYYHNNYGSLPENSHIELPRRKILLFVQVVCG